MKAAALALVVLVLLSVVALYALANEAGTPSKSTQSTTLVSYSGTTHFDYLAELGPNLLYNETSLGPGQGALFPTIVRTLNLSYAYTLVLSRYGNISLTAGFDLAVSAPGVWNHTLNESFAPVSPWIDTPAISYAQNTSLNVTQLGVFLRAVQNQTGYTPPVYYLNFTEIVYATIEAGGTTTTYQSSPVLSFTFTPDLMTPGPLVSFFSGSVTTSKTVTDSGRTTDLWLLGAAFAGLLAGIAVTGFLTIQETRRQKSLRAQMREFTAPFRDAIAVTGTPPKAKNLIHLVDWQDLVRVADMLGKPILRWEYSKVVPPRYLFYVLDGELEYVYLVPREGRPDEEVLSQLI